MYNDFKYTAKTVVVLNAPPSAGKDVGASYLAKNFHNVSHKEFKKALFDLSIAVAQIDRTKFFELYDDRKLKETPTPLLFNRSPREHMIHTSETLIKPVYGKEYFGNVLAMSLDDGVNVISDGGFIEELQPVIKEVGAENVIIVRIHRDGCTFDGDSRDYLYGTSCVELDLENDGSEQDFYYNLVDLIAQNTNFKRG